jgi:hypothetical protein
MATLGLTPPPSPGGFGVPATPMPMGQMTGPPAPMLMQPAPAMTSVGGILPIQSLKSMLEEQKRASEVQQHQPLLTGLAGHVRTQWSTNRLAREQTVEQRMFKSVRQRRGEYDPDKLAQIRSQGGSQIYMMLTSNKCRGASAWLRDVLLGNGSDKPWTLKPSPIPSLPPEVLEELRQRAVTEVQQYMLTTGQPVPPTELRKFLTGLREEFYNSLYDEAKHKVENMERKMEDQMVEGGFISAFDEFLDDLTTFPAAVLKGPVVRNKNKLAWKQTGPGQYEPDISETMVLEWERVDPMMCYPSPASTGIDDGNFIERHKLRQQDLEALIGVEGYDDGAIRKVLEDYGRGGLQEWIFVDSEKAFAEGKSTTGVMQNSDRTIDALQFWGSVSGQMLLDWGMSEDEVPDPAKNYPVEVWLIGPYVIKALLNYHPLGQKPYYKASYEDIPGCFWGNAVTDLVRDCQDMCNSVGRAIANNAGIASGPQVGVNSDRIAPGESIEEMYPWKIWQFTSDPMGSTAEAVTFFQPKLNVAELMAVFEKFAVLADEYSSIPRYMTGDSPTGGAGRTASGMSMLMTNANKSMKQVVSNIDNNVLTPLLDRLYFYNMKYGEDDSLKGDVQIVAKGAIGVVAKESAQVRRNEFLNVIGANPLFTQVVGIDGISAILREAAKSLDMDPDEVVPPQFKLKLAQMMQAQAAAAAPPMPGAPPGAPPQSGSPPAPVQNRQMLQNSAPITDNFAPQKAA